MFKIQTMRTRMNYQSGERCYVVMATKYEDSIREVEYVDEYFQPNIQVNRWECPNCKKTLFTDEDMTIAFLKEE